MNTIFFLILGFLTSLLFPPYFFLPLGFIIFPSICWFIDKNFQKLSIIYTFKCIFGYAFIFLLSFLFWIQNPFYEIEETKNIFFVSFLLILLLAFIFSVIFIFILKINKRVPVVILIPIIFVIIEYLISNLLYGFPWLTFSLIISSVDYFSFFFKYFGTFISSYITLQIFCLPYFFVKNGISKIKFNYYLTFILLPIIIILVLNFKYDNKDLLKKEELELEIFQLNFKSQAIDNYNEEKFEKIIQNIKSSNSKLMIFAENNYPYLVDDFTLPRIQSILKKDQIVIIGATRLSDNSYFNTLLNISSDEIKYFDKKILVPFGEFLPFRKFLFFLSPIAGSNDFSKGKNKRIIKVDQTFNYIPVICYEIIFYWKLINSINFKSNLLINITNDIWFGKYLGPYQHFYLSKIRAAEFNKVLIRVSNNGISGIINENGRILSTLNLNETGSIKYKIKLNDNKNLYQTHYFLKLYFFAMLIILIVINFFQRNDSK